MASDPPGRQSEARGPAYPSPLAATTWRAVAREMTQPVTSNTVSYMRSRSVRTAVYHRSAEITKDLPALSHFSTGS